MNNRLKVWAVLKLAHLLLSRSIRSIVSVLAVALLVTACGGGGGEPGVQPSGGDSPSANSITTVVNQSGGQATLNNGTTVTFDSNLVKDGTAVTISTLPPEPSTSTEISSQSSLVRIALPIDALLASGSLPGAGITISIPITGVVAAAVTARAVTSVVGQSYRYVQANLSAGTASVIFYGKVGVAATSIAAKIYQAQMVNFYKSAGATAQNVLTVDALVNLVQPNVPTAGMLFNIQHIGSSGNFSTDYSFVDSFADRLLPNSGLPLGKIPLVLVHGIQLGCDGNAEAYKATWEQFITFFFSSQGQALRGKYQLYTFSYQTDQHIEDNGRLLANALKVTFGNVPTVIVAHSMGGLVTRSAMVQHAGISAQIGGVITLGAPHHGTKVVNEVAGAVDHYACVLATGSPGADDLAWDNFDDPSKACGNSFLCGTAGSPHVNSSGITSIGINTADTASNYTKYIPYAGVLDPSSPLCLTYLSGGVPALIFDATTYGMCMGASKIKTAGYSSDGMVPEVSARFTDFIGGQYFDKLQWSAKLRTYQGIHHSSIHDDHRNFEKNPNGSNGGLAKDLLDFYNSLIPPAVNTTGIANGATGVSVSTAASSTFSVAIDASTLNTSTFTLSGPGGLVAGTVTYNATTNTAIFTPSAPLAYVTTYTATITTGVKDLAGSPLASNYSWSFTTGGTGGATTRVVAGDDHSLALKADGSVWAWGRNVGGGLGDGTTVNRLAPVPVMAPGSGVTQLVAGGVYSLALKSDGSVWAWGGNGYGQLGDGTTVEKLTPVLVMAPGSGVTQLAAGGVYSLALKSDGSVWAWGDEAYGALGRLDKQLPVQVMAPGSGVTQLVAGGYHSLALKSDGSIWAWGYNVDGQLGDGTTVNKLTPVRVIAPGSGVTQLVAGHFHSLALKSDGSVWAWGGNYHGNLGDGTTVEKHVPTQMMAPGSGVTQLVAGSAHSLALKADGSVWAWGSNPVGELGDGTTVNKLTPVRVIAPGSGVTQLAAGSLYSLALKADGSVWAWGDNGNGQLGDGTTVDKLVPTRISFP